MRYFLMTIAFLLLTACGQKGALYLEKELPVSVEDGSADQTAENETREEQLIASKSKQAK